MSGININFDHKKIKKATFTKNKKVLSIDETNKILVSKKEPYGTKNPLKYFIGYNDNDVIRPLRLPQMTGYARKFDKNATRSFEANNKQFLKNYNKIWEKVEKLMKMDFVYSDDDKYIKRKRKVNAGSMTTSFHDKKMPKERAPCC